MQELKICIYNTGGADRLGSADGDAIYDVNYCCVQHLASQKNTPDAYRLANNLAPSGLRAFIAGGGETIQAARDAISFVKTTGIKKGPGGEPLVHDARSVKLRAPILPDSTKVICLGDTFESHLTIRGDEVPDRFGLFYKMTQVVVGPDDHVVIPKHHDGPMVYGAELTVVIGKEGRSIPEDETAEHVWGYTILNDVTLRGLHSQLGPTPKVFDTSAPIGPWIVPKDQVADPQDVGLKFRISGRPVQDGSTASMRFQILDMLSEISKWHTLRPGDVIATGDLGSVEPVNPGDVMEAEVEGIGILRNPVKLED